MAAVGDALHSCCDEVPKVVDVGEVLRHRVQHHDVAGGGRELVDLVGLALPQV